MAKVKIIEIEGIKIPASGIGIDDTKMLLEKVFSVYQDAAALVKNFSWAGAVNFLWKHSNYKTVATLARLAWQEARDGYSDAEKQGLYQHICALYDIENDQLEAKVEQIIGLGFDWYAHIEKTVNLVEKSIDVFKSSKTPGA